MSPVYLEITVMALGIFMVLYEAFATEKEKSFLPWIGIGGLGFIFLLSLFAVQDVPGQHVTSISTFYKADAYALFFKRFALLTTIIVLIMSVEYKETLRKFIYGATPESGVGEFFSLPVFTCAGLMWMASAVDFVMIFVSLELVTISFYILVSYTRRNTRSLEAGVKYLILGALSTGFLVYGITWIFGITGRTNLDRIADMVAIMPPGSETPLLFGIVLVLIALGFKIAAAPFQFWVPDVYQGAATPVTAFLSVGSKAAGFIVLLRVLSAFGSVPLLREKIIIATTILAALTLVYGNLAAMPQNNLKRLLAYSSIAHAGYLLVAVASLGAIDPQPGVAVAFYLGGYLVMTLLSFIVMIVVANHSGGDDIAHFNGLGKRSPQLAFAMLAAMLSLAGVPFTVGFFGKFLVFEAAVQQHQYLLIGIGIVTVGAGFYYYLKVVRAIYWSEPAEGASPITVAPLTKAAIVVLTALVFFLGVYPQPVLNMLKDTSQETPPAVPPMVAVDNR
jgi:NADH-quinone oxidoreductase subunit N